MELNNDKTSIEYFNDYTRDFVRDVQVTFPEYSDLLGEYYSDILTEGYSGNNEKLEHCLMKREKSHNVWLQSCLTK